MFHPTLHRCVFWTHLAAGIAAGLVIFVLAATGLLMSFEKQTIDLVERAMVRANAHGDTTPLTVAEMVAAFQNAGIHESPGSICYSSAADAPVVFQTGRDGPHVLHPTTGRSLGKGAEKTRRFFKTALSLHRWLSFSAEPSDSMKSTGGRITATGALVFLFLLVSGLIIWIPKNPSWKGFRAVFTIQPRLKGRARDWNRHNVAGIWASPFILIICLTGIIMAYPWANRLLYQCFGETPPVKRVNAHMMQAGGPVVISRLDAAFDFAALKVPAWRDIILELPTDDRKPLVVTISDAGRGRPDRREKFTLDPVSLAIVKHESFSDMKPGQRARQIVRWLHTGEFGGWFGQLLAALTCAAVMVLVWTGFALGFRRFFTKRKSNAV